MKNILKYLALLLGTMSLLTNQSFAQRGWFWQNPLPVGGALAGVKFVSSTEGWITTAGGQLLHTLNAGATWSEQSPSPTMVIEFFSGPGPNVSFLKASTGWVIGFFGGI